MKIRHKWLILATPFLISIAVIGFFQRNGTDRIQVLPALSVGIGLLYSSALDRKKIRSKILSEINETRKK